MARAGAHVARLREHLAAPIDGSSLAAFRILFGLLMALAAVRFMAQGWVEGLLLNEVRFGYEGFEWVPRVPAAGLYATYVACALGAFGVALGYRYRLSAFVLALSFTYLELLDKTLYLNHYYLLTLLAWWLPFMPLARQWSLDAGSSPTSEPMPRWPLWLLRAQLMIVYFFAGLAKVRADWLLGAEPLTTWLGARADMPLVGPLLILPGVAHAMSWAGMLFDLTIGPLLLFRKTRPFAYAAVVAFHSLTGALFPIGVFPLAMVAMTSIFFAPDWPRRFLPARLRPIAPAALNERGTLRERPRLHAGLSIVLGLYLLVQVTLPLRSALYSSHDAWSHEGFRFAWKVMLIEKVGHAVFHVYNQDGPEHWVVHPRELLPPLSERTMATRPDMILQFARVLEQRFASDGYPHVRVTVDAWASLNGRPRARLIDPCTDLTRVRWDFSPARWVLPLPEQSHARALQATQPKCS